MTATLKQHLDWYCPQCDFTTQTARVDNVWHVCPKLQGVSVQLVRVGTSAKIELIEREDFIANERVQLLGVNKRPIMAAKTTRDEGTDMVVFAPIALARSSRSTA